MFKRKKKRSREGESFDTSQLDSSTQQQDTEEDSLHLEPKSKKRGNPSSSTRAPDSQPDAQSLVGHSFSSSRQAAPAEYGGGAVAVNLQAESTESTQDDDKGESHASIKPINQKTESGKNRGPLKAPANLRVTSRFDYQPDVCKDYKETGFCGYGDSCIYLHDRGNYKTGWQLEKEWQAEQNSKAAQLATRGESQQSGDSDTGKRENDKDLPFACFICRKEFKVPVETLCGHFFCQTCALGRFKKTKKCAVCGEQTKGVFNAPKVQLPKPPPPHLSTD